MTSSKVAHVLRAPAGDGRHTCHWPGCAVRVRPAMWGCRHHWFQLPDHLRSALWRAYEPGQEDRKDPSDTYIEVAHRIQQWIAERNQENG